ncbi:aldehyde dehydrogenase family protein [uncultured Martelella sp.]|uniref:aldehyde dehydrogenase family protein n=1 Tax=uncultured Martelella sp. TaxID=392331 RepID=UPI0029C99022|nr:aldehyde dehydrogenase family protein [uncultured Martelella sp.]
MSSHSKPLTQLPYSDEATRFLARPPRLFINGEWTPSSSGNTVAVIDPSSGKEITRIAEASEADVDRAVAAARTAFDDSRWTGLAPTARERLIHHLADLLERDADKFAELEAIDNGKPKAFAAAGDLPFAIANLRYVAGWTTKLAGETIEPGLSPEGTFHAYLRREPIGVAAQIVPWNFPLSMAIDKIAPALAAGCTIVLKPAELTSLTALRLADLIIEAGFPAGVVNIVTGRGSVAGERLVRHPDVDKVSFTGSTAVGKHINTAATETMKRVTLELGGKSPVVVLPDFDADQAAAGAAQAIFYNAGQVCVAGSRLYVHSSIFDKVVEGLASHASYWAPRPSLDPDAHMGPVVSQGQFDRVMGYIEAGTKAGASLATGGDAPSSDGGYYINPTVLVDVKPDMGVVREEIFGPVLVAQRYDDLDDVVRQANDTPYGLAAGIWTHDLGAMHRLASKIKAGTIWGNTHGAVDPLMPFGGYKQSGIGRQQGRAGVEMYTELKSVIIRL